MRRDTETDSEAEQHDGGLLQYACQPSAIQPSKQTRLTLSRKGNITWPQASQRSGNTTVVPSIRHSSGKSCVLRITTPAIVVKPSKKVL